MSKLMRDPIVLLVAGVVLAYLLTNGVMLWVSMRAPTDLVSADYYAQSKRVNERQAAERASLRAGWRLELVPQAVPDTLLLRVTSAGGAPVTGLTGAARAYRPSDARLDQPLALEPAAGEPGFYRLRFATPRAGLWEIELNLTGERDVLHERIRFVAP
jgi:nitrogen fixation protein FixH